MAGLCLPSKVTLTAPPETVTDAATPLGRCTFTVTAPPLTLMGTEPEGEPNVMFSRLAPVFSSMSATGTLDSLKTSLDAPLSTTIFQMTAVLSFRSSAERRACKNNPGQVSFDNLRAPLDSAEQN